MRTLKLLPLALLLLAGCNTTEPEEGERPDDETPVTTADVQAEQSVEETTTVQYEYADYFHNFEFRTTSTEEMEFGVQHTSSIYSIGRRELGEYYSDYKAGDTLVVNISIPFWHLFRLPDYFDAEIFFDCEDAYTNGDELTVSHYEPYALGVYKPRPVAVVNSTLILLF